MTKRSGGKLLNYTTQVDPLKTAGEMMGLLVAKGAKSINMDYKDGEPVALAFVIAARGVDVAFRLPCNVDGVRSALNRTSRRSVDMAQAKRVAWRIIKHWLEAQLAIVECGQAEMAEVFLPYAIIADTNQTLFQRFNENPMLITGQSARMLTSGDSVVDGEIVDAGEQ